MDEVLLSLKERVPNESDLNYLEPENNEDVFVNPKY